MIVTIFHVLLLVASLGISSSSCANLGYCNGHGVCKLNSACECFEGWGADGDITTYKAADCSAKVCPSGNSWGDLPDTSGATHRPAECSDKGICNRITGKCKCADGFEGAACQRLKCLNNCSGHGRCMTMERMASSRTAFPLSSPTTYQSSNSSAAWDSRKIIGCVCESSWPVGLGANQTQEAEWFGPDCSMRRCPSADNPRTSANETDCSVPAKLTEGLGVSVNRTMGEYGNLCHVDCANQGICDFSTGTCTCFKGQYGTDCSLQVQVAAKYQSEDGIYAPQPLQPDSTDAGVGTAGDSFADTFGLFV